MKFTITLHPVSLLVGAAALGGVLWLASAAQSKPRVLHGDGFRELLEAARINEQALIASLPDGLVYIREGTPFVVPAGKELVPIGLGTTAPLDSSARTYATLRVNGQVEYFAPAPDGVHPKGALSAPDVPLGLTIKAGSTVSVESWRSGDAFAFGRLHPQ